LWAQDLFICGFFLSLPELYQKFIKSDINLF
jgi:hypothetical protein